MYLKRNNVLDIVALYCGGYARKIYLREISALARLPLKTTQTALGQLEHRHILKSEVSGKNKYFALNLEDINTKLTLLHAEAYRTEVFLIKYPQFKIFMKELRTRIPLIVFGSFAAFKAGKSSDVDILVIAKDKAALPYHVLAHQPHEVRLDEASFIKALQKREALLKEIEEHHIILNNHSFYVDAMWEHYGANQA